MNIFDSVLIGLMVVCLLGLSLMNSYQIEVLEERLDKIEFKESIKDSKRGEQ